MKYFLIALMFFFATAHAGDEPEAMIANSMIFRKFDQSLFDSAQAEGKPILVIVSKSDCPGCRTQAPTLAKILKESEYKDIEVFQTDFVNQPDLAKKFNAAGWTLLIAYKGKTEVNRAYGLMKPSQLKQFLITLK